MHKIGKLKLQGELLLAPMADYTNVAYRTLAKEYGAALCYTELISAKALTMKSKRTEAMLAVSEKEKPVFLQLFGDKAEDFSKALKIVEEKYPKNFAGYDLNCGCAVPKALRGKYGCSMMTQPQNVGHVVRAMKKSIENTNPKKPITVKMRLGLKEENFLEVAKEAVDAGADAITLHPRLGKQSFGGEADWSKIKQLKEAVSVPVIGNGDIKKSEDVLLMKKETNCDMEMVGRAAIGNAFFFKQAKDALDGKEVPQRKLKDVAKEGKRFLEIAEEFELKANDVRPYFIGLAKGLIGASFLRNRFGTAKSVEEIKNFFYAYAEF